MEMNAVQLDYASGPLIVRPMAGSAAGSRRSPDQDGGLGRPRGGDLIPMKLNQDRGDCTTPTGFCTVFNDHFDRLYTLSLLLTADHRQAEQCFVAALDDCLQRNPVFLEWAQPWATRTVIKNAIRIISPLRSETDTTTENDNLTESRSQAGVLLTAITRLQPFDRFVFVMSILEKYSDRECSTMLDCTVDEVVGTRTQAPIRLADAFRLEGQRAFDRDPRILPVVNHLPDDGEMVVAMFAVHQQDRERGKEKSMNNSTHSDPAERTALMRLFCRNWRPTRLGRWVDRLMCCSRRSPGVIL